MSKLPHFPWPFQLGQTVEQGTIEALQAEAGVVLSTPRGYRDDAPEFGVTLPLGETAPVDTAVLASELEQSAPILDAEFDDASELVTATVARLNVDLTARG